MCPRVSAGLGLVLAFFGSIAAAADVVDAIELDAVPERTVFEPPAYPAEQAKAGGAVDVRVALVIEFDGRVGTIEILEAAPPAFAAAARATVGHWRFSPGFVGGKPARYRLNATVLFRSDGLGAASGTSLMSGGLALVAEPSVEWEVAPAYPAELATSPRDGIAVVNLLVDAVGTPSDVVVEYASHAAFAAAAREAVLGWKFNPAEHAGRLVSARMQVALRFPKADAALSADDLRRQAQYDQSSNYDVPPEELLQVPLVYPYEALLKGERGTVSLNLLISPEGQVVTIEPDPGSNTEFAVAAGACVSCWTFNPATKGGEPVFGWVKWQLLFTDDSGELQLDEVGRDLLAALRAGTFRSTPQRELEKPVTPRERIAPRLPPGLGAAAGGEVLIDVIVDRNGRVQFPRVISAPMPSVGYAAATAALRWRFEPPRTKSGEPANVRVKIPFQIMISDPAPASGGEAAASSPDKP